MWWIEPEWISRVDFVEQFSSTQSGLQIEFEAWIVFILLKSSLVPKRRTSVY